MTTAEAELERLQQSLEAVVTRQEVVALNEGYVPRGPETVIADALTESASGRNLLDKSADSSEDEHLEVPSNRFSGVIYAARFFVTRVGFLRSVKRCVAMTYSFVSMVELCLCVV